MRVEHGATRTVILTHRWAVKLPGRWCWTNRSDWWRLFLLGLLANAQERQWWRDAPYLHDHLCPIRWSVPGGWCVVMIRATPFSQHDMTELWHDSFALTVGDQLHTVEHFKTRDADEHIVPGEIKATSLGWIDNRVVVIDYGN